MLPKLTTIFIQNWLINFRRKLVDTRYEIRDIRNKLSCLASRISYLTIPSLFFLFFLTSCEDPKNIGLTLGSGTGQITTSFTDTISIAPATMLMDSTITSGRTEILAGNYTDPVFGGIESKCFFQVNLPDGNIYYNTQYPQSYDLQASITDTTIKTVYDSVGVYVRYNGFNYGKDTLQNLTLSLHQLTEKVDVAKHYVASNAVSYNPTPVVTKTITIRDLKSINGDTLKSIQFKLPNDFGKKLFALSGQLNSEQTVTTSAGVIVYVGDNDKLHKFIQGYALVAKKGPNVVYSFNTSSSYLFVAYHRERKGIMLNSSDVEVTDPTLNSTIARYAQQFTSSNGGHFSQIKVNRQGTALASITQSLKPVAASQLGGKTYVQNGTGMTTKITISQASLKNLLKQGNVAINKAELVFTTPTDSVNNINPPQYISLIEVDKNNNNVKSSGSDTFIPSETSSAQVAIYDGINKRYKFNITTYLQDIIAGKRTSDGLIIVPVSSTGTSFITSNTNISRAVFSDKNLKLTIYYSATK